MLVVDQSVVQEPDIRFIAVLVDALNIDIHGRCPPVISKPFVNQGFSGEALALELG